MFAGYILILSALIGPLANPVMVGPFADQASCQHAGAVAVEVTSKPAFVGGDPKPRLQAICVPQRKT